ncbi:MAG: DUF1802 family protein [Verrucomicrobiae bacterium]|nr:DUF1802 family protein [Verrucomicrobiae bacterium]
MRVAFKEWAIVTDALLRGEQIIILRKGGIAEGRGGFRPEHEQFWLFPTQFHQQRESVVPAAQARFDELAKSWPPADRVRIEGFATLTGWRKLDTLEEARKLSGQHIWRDEVIASRYEWGREAGIYVLLVRINRLPAPVELPVLPAYAGCKSWIELERDLPTDGAMPVLSDAEFAARVQQLHAALQS